MADQKKQGKLVGIVGAAVVHLLILLLLLLVGIMLPAHHDESGMEVMLGNVESAYGNFDPASLVGVELEELPQVTVPEPTYTPPAVEQKMLTQETEETVVISPKAETKKETPLRETVKPELTAAEKEAAARRQAEIKAETERKAAAEAASKAVAGAFGRGTQMGGHGTGETGMGVEGSPAGNSPTGARTGTGGYGTFDLGGRSIGSGGLPRPTYNVQEEGRVVVTITVNPQGTVIRTSINPLTNTVNTALRRAAEEAAKKARFNDVEGVNNQTGTITYYFNLK